MEILTLLALGLLTLLVYAITKAIKVNSYWKHRGIPQHMPLPFVGDLLPVILRQKTMGELFADICEAHPNNSVIGFYFFMKPSVLLNDLDLVERVLIKDFPHFVDRGPQPNVHTEALQMTLFSTNGNLWRAIRSKFAPMFTTGKLRYMFPQVADISDSFLQLLMTNKKEKVDMCEYFGKYAMEVIANTAFGLEGKAMEENSEFREKGKKIFEPSLSNYFRFVLGPGLLRKMRVRTFGPEILDYFGVAVKDALEFRRKTGVTRADFLQHMLTLQQKGVIEVAQEDASEDILKIDSVPEVKVEMSDDLMVGQAMGFIIAGFDATALSMSWLCYELAVHPEIQEKAREEVIEVLAKHDGKLDYDIVREMKYLSYCMKENHRLHSALSSNLRMCSKAYKLPGTSHVVQPGEYVYVSHLRIHKDPLTYPQPEQFIPERWGPEHARHPCAYLPFGAGPRMCIAMRFADMEMMCVIAKLLVNFKIALHPSVELPLRIEPFSFFNYPRKRITFNLQTIEQ